MMEEGSISMATICCPQCGTRSEERMPEDACVHFYQCPACSTMLRPLPGDCCVFCSFANVRCPPQAAEGKGCG